MLQFGGFYIWTYTYNLIKTAGAIQHEKTNPDQGDEEEATTPLMNCQTTSIFPAFFEMCGLFRKIQGKYEWWSKAKEIFAPSTIGAVCI